MLYIPFRRLNNKKSTCGDLSTKLQSINSIIKILISKYNNKYHVSTISMKLQSKVFKVINYSYFLYI